jgi:hypothetical protein
MGAMVNPVLARLSEPARLHAVRHEARIFEGSLREVEAQIPSFERRPLSLDGEAGGVRDPRHPHLDLVVRCAGPGAGLIDVPVGVVSRRYQLIAHGRVLNAIDKALGAARADPEHASSQLELAAFGAQMSLAVDLPRRFDFDPGDGVPLGLRVLCHNSVNGGGLRLLTCWQRRGAGVSVVVGTTRLEWHLAHRLPARLSDVVPSIHRALQQAQAERDTIRAWRERLLTRDRLVEWVNGPLRRMWGARAAARVFHISMCGWDALPAFCGERVPPTRRTMQATSPVPEAPAFVETAYDALLAVAWVARDGRDFQDRFDRLVEIAVLMRSLLKEPAR